MTATEPTPRVRQGLPTDLAKAATAIVNALLGEGSQAEAPVCEASVHLPRRGRIWLATFTGPMGGQVWKSTGLTNRTQALLLAKHWEAQARAQRASIRALPRRPILRVRRNVPGTIMSGPLTQKEVAMLLNISERAVREIERRALQKLRNHPLLRQVWRQYLAPELDEHQLALSLEEIRALLNLARMPEERSLILKVLRLIQR